MNDSEPSSARRKEEILRQALLRGTPQARAAFLDGACGSDAALRVELEALLGTHAEGSVEAGPTLLAEAPVAEKPGSRIGHYKLLQELGRGGCGIVYLAEQEEPVRRQVALKVIKLGMDTREVVARFEAERQALALMDHPNIAKVFDAGATGQGRPFFVMELVRGIRITDYCDQNQLNMQARLELFINVCQAVQHAHQKGIIHRDIKPSNILVTLQDGKPVAKVIDFGIAKATAGQVLTDRTVFTAFEQFLGTPTYMSPEQAEMSALDIDTRSDIYSLGVLLYELLTGKTPFDPMRLLEGGLGEIRRIIREEEPLRPSTRLSTLAAEEQTTTARCRSAGGPQLIHLLRGDLDWIVMKALEKDRTRRYETATALAADIQRHLDNEPVAAHAPSRLYRFQKLVRRNKLAFAAAAIVFAALAIGLSVSLWSLRQAHREARRSAQVARFLRDMLQGVGPSAARGRDTTMLREILRDTAQRLEKDLKGQPEVAADLRTTIGSVYYDMGQYTNAETMFREALALRKKSLGNVHTEVASSLHNLAMVLEDESKLPQAESLYREALAMKKKVLGADHPEVAILITRVAGVLRDQGKFAEAEALHREGLAMNRRLLGNEHQDVAGSMNNLAIVLQDQGKLAEAETLYREALGIERKLLGNDHPDVASALNNLAMVLDDEARLPEAEAVYREALSLRRKLLGGEHPDIADSLNNLAIVLRKQGKLAEAEALQREGLAMKQKLLGSEHPRVGSSLNNLAAVLDDEGKFAEAEALLRQALALQKKALGNEHPRVATALFNLGTVLREQDKLVEASQAHREALDMQRKLLGNEHPDVAASLSGLADVLVRQGRLSEAQNLYREAIAMQKKFLGGEHPEVAGTLAALARALVPEKKFAEAETAARECLAILEKGMPEGWKRFDAKSLLGGCLAGQKKYSEAEPLLSSGYQGLKEREPSIPAAEKSRLRDALLDLARLCEATGKPAEAAAWKRELAAPAP